MFNTIRLTARRHVKLFVWCGMFLFLGITCVGVIRLMDYTLPMWEGRYVPAGTNKTLAEQVEDPDEPRPTFGLEPEEKWSDRALMALVRSCPKAVDGVVGRRVEAMFNAGIQAYQKQDYDTAIAWMEKAHEACTDRDGKVPESARPLASLTQLVLGMAHENSTKKNTDRAYECYKQALTYDGDNIFATYNLERLQDSKKSGGKGNDKGDKDPKPAAPKKRI